MRRSEQGDGEGECGGAADEVAEAGVRLLDCADVGVAGVVVEELGGDGEHCHVDEAGEAKRDDDVGALEASTRARSAPSRTGMRPLVRAEWR